MPADDQREAPYVRGRDLRIEAIEDSSALAEFAAPSSGNPQGDGNLASLTDGLDARLQFENATVPDLSVYNRYLPRTDLRIEGGTGTLSGDLHFDGTGNVANGTFRVAGDAVRIAVAGMRLEADLVADTRIKRADMETLAFDASGSRIELREVRMLDEDPTGRAGWWSAIDFDRARLDWGRPLAFDGQLRLRMKDAGPLLDIYAERKDLPAWIEPIIGAGEISAQGGLQWRGDLLVLEPLQASNERFEIAARLRMQHKHLAGDLFARWGLLGLGVELDGTDRQVHLTGAREWFDSRTVLPAP